MINAKKTFCLRDITLNQENIAVYSKLEAIFQTIGKSYLLRIGRNHRQHQLHKYILETEMI